MSSSTELLATERRDRLRAIRDLPLDAAAGYALRRVLYTDRDAEVRAAAARRLGDVDPAEPWLLDALGDRSPLVRDTIVRSLAKCGGPRSLPVLRALVHDERMWWIRRSAIYALAALAGAAGSDQAATLVTTFDAALADPFWRVRHAAVRVLAVLGARDPDVRDQVIGSPPSSARAFLRAAWGPVAIEAPTRARSASLLPDALLDPDPAVVTARLATLVSARGREEPQAPRARSERSTVVSPVALVELLCDPHAPLRELAADRIAASGDRDAHVAALDWLDEPRIPHVADTVEHLLDGLGDPAIELATHALARADRPGAARWAIDWVVRTGTVALHDAVLERARTDAGLRRAALRVAGSEQLLAWARDDHRLVDDIAIELHERHADDALLELDVTDHARARALQIDVAARRERWDLVDAALVDRHHGPRAIATRWLVRAARIDGTTQIADPDPSVREAALTPGNAARLIDDADPWVARAAIQMLAAAWHGRLDRPAELAAPIACAFASRDPWVRAQACRLPLVDDDVLARVVACLGDADAMVRAAAHEALELGHDIDARVARLHATAVSDDVRAMAYAWSCRRLDDAARALARAALADAPTAGRVRPLLAAIVGDAPTATPIAEPSEPARPLRIAPAAPAIDRRPFGRAGFSVGPLAISGAFDLSPVALQTAADAGVDLFFWEPAYTTLTYFLQRRPHARVIAGSYHADPASIEADVDRACRRLRRTTLDVFLLFWSRSPARVDHDAFAALERIKRSGKVRAIGFSTHDRALARAAIEADPWDVVMIRHSAAHPGIEIELLPTARATGTAIVTFSALCYGRMVSGPNAPAPVDCYRYSLSQPGVVACISAPRRRRELAENLGALATPVLSADQLAALRAHGVTVRAANQRFNTLLRQPTRDAAAAARELLAGELPPADEIVQRPLPRATAARGARTSLGATRRRGR
jgi:hypothetical protein